MIRLVATDIDGTILPPGEKEIPQAIFDEAKKLADAGIAFCFASGRQYENLKKAGFPLLDQAYFMCENGAVLFSPGEQPKLISKTPMEWPCAMAISHQIMSYPDCEVFISGENTTYLCPKGDEVTDIAEHLLANNLAIVASPEAVPEPIVKVSAFCTDAYAMQPLLAADWEERFTVSIAGDRWVDLTLANKGTALADLCAYLQIPLSEVAAFGDNFNDLPMLAIAGKPYIMENSDPELKKMIPNHCADVPAEMRRIRLAQAGGQQKGE